MTEFDDIYYIRRIKGGETDAFAYIARRYQRMIFTIVNKIVASPVEAEDIVQDIFVKIFQSIDKFREESEFTTWVYRIAYNTTISQLRKRRYEFVLMEEGFENLPDDKISDDIDNISLEQQLSFLDMVLAKLSPDDAMLITMFYIKDFSIRDISEITGLSEGNVKVKLHRIRKFMNFEINKLIKDEAAG